jgi:hypothetical protein
VWKRVFAPLNFVVFFAITLPWFIGLCVAKKDFFHYGIVDETFKRFTSAQKFGRAKPIYYYPAVVTLAFLPWSLFLPEAIVATWRARWARHRADILCLVWSLAVIAFFSISQSKQTGYILSVPVACGILIARLVDVALTNPSGRAAALLRRSTVLFVAICGLALLALAVAWLRGDAFAKMARFSVEEAERWKPFAMPAGVFFGSFFLLGVVGLLRRNTCVSFLTFALACPLALVANHRAFLTAVENKSGRAVADAMPSLPPQTEIVMLECFPAGLPFYLRRTLTLVSDDGEELTSNYIPYRLSHSKVWPSNIVRVAEFEDWLKTRQRPVFLIGRARQKERLDQIAARRGAAVQPLTARFSASLLAPPGAP